MRDDAYAEQKTFQSTLSVRRATRPDGHVSQYVSISIHALRKESDIVNARNNALSLFQSTLSVRRATKRKGVGVRQKYISIHALRKESDVGIISSRHAIMYFNPRSP